MTKEKTQAMNVRFPISLHDKLRDLAHKERISINQIVVDAVTKAIKKGSKDKS